MNLNPIALSQTTSKPFNRFGLESGNSEDKSFSNSGNSSGGDQFIPHAIRTNDRYNPYYVRSGISLEMIRTLLIALDNAKNQDDKDLMGKILKRLQGFGML